MTDKRELWSEQARHYKTGIFIGLILAGIIFFPLTIKVLKFHPLTFKEVIRLFSAFLFSAEKTIPAGHPYVVSSLFLACLSPVYFKTLLFSRYYFLGSVPTVRGRVITSALFSLYFAFLFWILLMLVNALGVIFPFTKLILSVWNA